MFFYFTLADIIHIDPLFHRYTFNDSPPNEFCLQADDEILMEEFPIDMKPNFTKPIEESTMVSSMNSIKIDLLETITDVIKQILEIKQNEKVCTSNIRKLISNRTIFYLNSLSFSIMKIIYN